MHVLARTGRLPDHHYLDQHTLTWIVGNRPTRPCVRATMPHRPVLLMPTALGDERSGPGRLVS
ncbi:hypothetical protein KV557_12895 [Kitasatospora aureofaciens]|uniref:hypothetical protein n=1 Tax=Kitasatospora aureofaciens TaxID=1894 RepID=UPI001C46AAF0|nr:hypothetical protein [Kitasatospora aureofaciens]MBV6698019.1 hypothetical protein [Kitasatospora aureofaciens]